MHKGAYRECYQCGRKFTKDSGVLKEIKEIEPEKEPETKKDNGLGGIFKGKKDVGGFGQVLPKGTPNKPRVVK